MDQALCDGYPPANASRFASPFAPSAATDNTGFDIGWDHARHDLVPPPQLSTDDTPLGMGWRTGKAVFGRRMLPSNRATRSWLALRTEAWLRGVPFDLGSVTPQHLALVDATRCPVLRLPLGGAAGQPGAAVTVRLDTAGAFAAGNLVVVSQRAAALLEGSDIVSCLRRSHATQQEDGIETAAWSRLAALRSYATPLPFGDALQMAMAVLPPTGVRPVNAPQQLQALVTLLFTAPGWSARTRELAGQLPAHTVRHDFLLFIGALAPRVLEAGRHPAALRTALEDAWLNDRVQRRWQYFVRCLGEAGTRSLLESAERLGAVRPEPVGHGRPRATPRIRISSVHRARFVPFVLATVSPAALM